MQFVFIFGPNMTTNCSQYLLRSNHLLQNSFSRRIFLCTNLISINRLLPYGRMSFGLFLVLLNIAACLVGKGVSMFTIDFGRNSDLKPVSVSDHSNEPTLQSLYVVLAWICINILPQVLFVSINQTNKCVSRSFHEVLR